MPLLIAAALLWIGIHLGLAGTALRDAVVRRIGESAFRIAFSLLSAAALLVLVLAWRATVPERLWVAPNWFRWLLTLAMLPAFLLLAASVSAPNPTALGPPGSLTQPPRGITRITRHPMLWSFAIWAAVHLAGSGDTAALVFFGAFLITALAGMPSIDAKLARRQPTAWATLAAETSILPFAAILQRRNRFAAREIGWTLPLLSCIVWIAVFLLHPLVFGVAAAVL